MKWGYDLHMDSQIQADSKPLNVYTVAQVHDVLEEARRLDLMGTGSIVVDASIRKLDSLNHGRTDA